MVNEKELITKIEEKAKEAMYGYDTPYKDGLWAILEMIREHNEAREDKEIADEGLFLSEDVLKESGD